MVRSTVMELGPADVTSTATHVVWVSWVGVWASRGEGGGRVHYINVLCMENIYTIYYNSNVISISRIWSPFSEGRKPFVQELWCPVRF